jgi:hypothetical protein
LVRIRARLQWPFLLAVVLAGVGGGVAGQLATLLPGERTIASDSGHNALLVGVLPPLIAALLLHAVWQEPVVGLEMAVSRRRAARRLAVRCVAALIASGLAAIVAAAAYSWLSSGSMAAVEETRFSSGSIEGMGLTGPSLLDAAPVIERNIAFPLALGSVLVAIASSAAVYATIAPVLPTVAGVPHWFLEWYLDGYSGTSMVLLLTASVAVMNFAISWKVLRRE